MVNIIRQGYVKSSTTDLFKIKLIIPGSGAGCGITCIMFKAAVRGILPLVEI